MRQMRRLALFVIPVVCILAFVGGAGWWISSLGSAPDGTNLQFSPRVTDRNSRLLRAYTTSDGRWRLPARIADVEPRFFDVLFAYEDRHFREHHGVDAPALVRAALQFVGSGRIRSGGSTLTMQVARLLEPRSGRTLAAKFRQIVRAIELERMLTKDQILSLYLELAPYGGNIEGIRAASLAYFGKEPRRLTLGEAALLVALPQSPEARRPDRSVNAARVAKDRVLNRFAALSHVPIDEISAAKAEMVPTGRRPMPMLAAHAADRAIGEGSPNNEVRLTIDADLQKSLEELAHERVRGLALTLGPDVSLAILVVDNKDGAVVARVGSPNYFDTRRAGQLDLTRTLRSPGSTLKPFIYGLGFEDGFVHPETSDRRPADALRLLCAAEFRLHLSGHGHGALSAATLTQFAGTRGARSGWREPFDGAPFECRRITDLAGRRNAGARHRSRRRRHHAVRSGDALFGHCAPGLRIAAY